MIIYPLNNSLTVSLLLISLELLYCIIKSSIVVFSTPFQNAFKEGK